MLWGGIMSILNNIVVTDIISVMTVFSPRGRFEKMNKRKFYGLSFCNQGQIIYTHKQKEYISNPDYAIILPAAYGNSPHFFCGFPDGRGIPRPSHDSLK